MSCRPQPATNVPVRPCIPAPQDRLFLLVLRTVAPLSPPLALLVPLSTSVCSPFLVTSFLRHLLNQPPPPPTPQPPTGLNRGPGPFPYRGGWYLQYWYPTLLRRASSSPSPVPPCILVSSGSSCIRLGALLRVLRGLGASTPM